MKNLLFAFSLCACTVAYADAPTTGTTALAGGGAGSITYSCWSNSAYTVATPCGLTEGKTLYLSFSTAVTQATYGHFSGTYTSIDSTHGKIVAPASIIPEKSSAGVQVGPNDSVFTTDVYNLPIWSLDASFHHPICTTGSLNNPGGSPCQGIAADGPSYTFPAFNFTIAPTEYETILDGTEPISWNLVAVYGNPVARGTFPDARELFKNKQENGLFNSAAINIPNGGKDTHGWMIDPVTGTNWEQYQMLLYGFTQTCNQGPAVCTDSNCSTLRRTTWDNYRASGGINAGGTPLGPLEISLEDVYSGAIKHATPSTIEGHMIGTQNVWPGNGTGDQPTRPPYGSRLVLDKNFSLTGVHFVTVSNFGTGYTPGSSILGTVADCPGAQIIAWIAPGGDIWHPGDASAGANANRTYAFVSKTGSNCVNPGTNHTISFASPSSGTTAQGTASTFGGFTNSTYGNEFITWAQHYGTILTDTSGVNPVAIQTSPDLGLDGAVSQAMNQFNSFNNPFLWHFIDETGDDATANDIRVPWGTRPGNGLNSNGSLWQVDSANPLIGSTVKNQTVLQLTPSGGAVNYLPIPSRGAGFGALNAGLKNRLIVMAGTTNYQINYWTVALSSSAGTWAFVTDPCPGSDSITNAGVYTACPSASVSSLLNGKLKFTSTVDPNVVGYINLSIIPALSGSPAKLGIDTGGAGLTDGNGYKWIADCCYEGSVEGKPNDSSWPWATYGAANEAAPTSIPSEANIYKSTVYTLDDIRFGVILPNGHYWVRILSGEAYNGNTQGYNYPAPLWTRQFENIGTQGSVKYWQWCFNCINGQQFARPADVIVPATVFNGQLVVGLYGLIPMRDVNVQVHAVDFAGSIGPELSGLQIIDDAGQTTPHWELGSWPWHLYGMGDKFKIGAGGQLKMYVKNFFTEPPNVTTSDAPIGTWSVSGSGTIDQTGLYTAPKNTPSGNACPVVSFTGTTYSASHAVCITSTSYAIK